jgi:hypothetical protein
MNHLNVGKTFTAVLRLKEFQSAERGSFILRGEPLPMKIE